LNERTNSPGWATYLRVSDEDKQTPERSFAMQRQRIQEHLLAPSDLPFKGEYYDVLTGTSPNRADYQRLLTDAEAGRFSHLGLYRADRFGRNTIEGLQAATRLIGLGIKIRVAHMPSLRPEEPDGFFMFLIQMGLAQREVDVLRQRTADGMEAKMRAGGWAQKAPDGYVNKERLVSSNKYDRWVELDPDFNHVIREAWDLLLTNRYTLEEICEELASRGYTRASGRPWVWNDSKNEIRGTAKNRLHNIFHNPFYAGWVVSERFGITYGEIRGNWEPTITPEAYERGIEILRKHDGEKSRFKKRFYLLRNLLWVELEGKLFKMFCSTPTGRSQSYAYYITQTKPVGKNIHIPCDLVDEKIPEWLAGIAINPELIPSIQDIYVRQVKQISENKTENQLSEVKRRHTMLKEEEARLARLLVTGKITEETYDKLRPEWLEKLHQVEENIADLQREVNLFKDDLDVALALMSNITVIFPRLNQEQQSILLRILAKRIIVNPSGEIINHELNSPFVYLHSLAEYFRNTDLIQRGSSQVRQGALFFGRSCCMPGSFDPFKGRVLDDR